MAIKIDSTTVINNSRGLENITNLKTIGGQSILGTGDISIAAGGTVTSVGGTGTVSGLTLTGTVTTTGNLTLGGTLSVTANDFASQTANTVLIAPNGTAGTPTFRALVAADIPTLNQNTTGTAANVTGTVAVANGGTGLTSIAAVSIPVANTANTYTTVTPAAGQSIRVAAGGTSWQAYTPTTGTVTSVGGTGTVSGLTLSGTVTSTGNLTLGGTLSVTAGNFASQTANTHLCAPDGTAGVPTFRAITVGDLPTITVAKGGTALTSIAARSILVANSANTYTTVTPAAGQAVRVNAGNTAWEAYTPGTGTVTSVGGTGTVSGLTLTGTVTSTGNLTLGGTLAVTPSNFASQVSNTVLASPNGSSGAPTFRALVAADLPTTTVAKGGTGLTSIAARSILVANTASTYTTVTPAAGQSIRINAGNTAWEAYTPGGTGTVTSVTGSGSTSGLSLSGTVTTSGSLTLSGTVNAVNGYKCFGGSGTTNTSGDLVVTFPSSFSGGVIGVAAISTSGVNVIVSSISNSQVLFQTQLASSGAAVANGGLRWVAVGA